MDPSLRHRLLPSNGPLGLETRKAPRQGRSPKMSQWSSPPRLNPLKGQPVLLDLHGLNGLAMLGESFGWNFKKGWVAEVDLKKRKPKENANWTLNSPPALATPFEPKRMAESSCSAAVTPLGFLWNGFIRLTLHHNLHLKWTPNPPKDRGRRRLSGIFFNALVSAQVVTICCWYLSAQDINQTSHPLSPWKAMSLGVLIIVWRSISQPLVGLGEFIVI